MALDRNDLEKIERLIYKMCDDLSVSIARSFERIEDRFDEAEMRLYQRLSEIETTLESKVSSNRQFSDE
jgi:hypothetical protein